MVTVMKYSHFPPPQIPLILCHFSPSPTPRPSQPSPHSYCSVTLRPSSPHWPAWSSPAHGMESLCLLPWRMCRATESPIMSDPHKWTTAVCTGAKQAALRAMIQVNSPWLWKVIHLMPMFWDTARAFYAARVFWKINKLHGLFVTSMVCMKFGWFWHWVFLEGFLQQAY